MLTVDEKRFGIIEIGETDPRKCVKCGADLWVFECWPLHRGDDYFTYRRCLRCGVIHKVLEVVPDNLFFMGEVPTNQHGEAE